ncbi:hypothetical protein QYE76_025510 [Lolium multiflorum]|uniref:SNF2 N-terminal domain-containing protein n=1 Tax=Lolium multiflorum TaxID=4521 RepID=A0AAD8RIP8_LOLMU|nr:hypothetical protein QYE76_025510 [Lolium multiflorum]
MDEMTESERPVFDSNQEFSMLDKILTQTQRYSELLLEEVPTKSTADEAALTEEEKWKKEQDRLIPSMIGIRVNPYFIKGVKWLKLLWQNGLNGIIEDPVEFRAVHQTLLFLAHLKENGLHGPYMIVTSENKTDIPYWSCGFRLFPTMKKLLYFGDKNSRANWRKELVHKTVGPDFPIILTTHRTTMLDKRWLADYKWKYVVVDERSQTKQWEYEIFEKLKHLPVDNKLLLVRSYSTKSLADLRSLLKFALPRVLFSCLEEFDSWFKFSGKEGEEQQNEEEIRTHLSKLHAILRPFLLRQMEDVENKVPQEKSATCYKAKVVQHPNAIGVKCSKNQATKEVIRTGAESCQAVTAVVPQKKRPACSDAMSVTCSKDHAAIEGARTGAETQAVAAEFPQKKGATCSDAIIATRSKDHAVMEGARTGAESSQEVAAEFVSETNGKGSADMRSSQFCLPGNEVVKRRRTNDAPITLLGESNPAVHAHVQVTKSTSSELIFKALQEIPDLARADILRAYSTLTRDDRQFESLMALPMDMRKDWLLMEIGNK